MNRPLSKFGLYLLCWTGLWVMLTVTTQLPECYQRSNALDAGTQSAIYRDLAEFAEYRALLEIPFGLLWGSLSWWLYLCRFDIHRHFYLPKLSQWAGSVRPSLMRLTESATLSAALAEGIVFGLPLSGLYISIANFGLGIGNDAGPPVTINNQSIAIEAAGIVLAFVLPTLIAGCIAGRVQPNWKSVRSGGG